MKFISLEEEIRATLPTKEAAFHLNRCEQTLRLWATQNTGPVKCLRINGRLAWPVEEIKKVLRGE